MNYLVILMVLVIGILAAAVFLLARKFGEKPKEDSSTMLLLQNQLHDMAQRLEGKLGESDQFMKSRISASEKLIGEVTEKLTKLDETNKQVINFADQLKSLQDILKNPKQRGVLGEYYLKTLLENVFPPGQYKMQYEFKDGSIVDAVIFTKDKIVPIDSKFSLENYNRWLAAHDEVEKKRLADAFRNDLKNRIDETSKYVKPAENTMDFAFMFIPSEAIYYDLLVNKVGTIDAKDLVEYAFRDRHVIIVSPTSFLAYLQTVIQGLRALKIEESAQEIRKRVGELGRHITAYDVYFKKLGSHLGTTVSAYNAAYKELGKIDKDVAKISEGEPTIEVAALPKPLLVDENAE